jgi:CheY-like chemotaxis protein
MNSPALLYVEDNLDDRVLFTMACKQGNVPFRLLSAEHGKEAVEYLSGSGPYANRQDFPLPDALLLDVKMPFLDGFGVLRWIRAQGSLQNLPVFIFTSSYQHADIHRAYDEKATAFLTKPSEFRALIRLAEALYRCFTPDGILLEPVAALPEFRRP